MKTNARTSTAAFAIGVALLSAAPAYAQASGDATGQASDESAGKLGEITVTARRVEESAQSTPISLIVNTGEDLTNASVERFSDLPLLAPSLHVNLAPLTPSSSYFSMRGHAVQETRLNIDTSISLYIDGVALPRATGSQALGVYDLARVEVLSGPQGTLFGKNTTGGAINIVTNEPTDRFEGEVRARAGNYDTYGLGGVLNLPLGQDLALRVVGDFNYRGGLGHDLVSKRRIGSYETFSGRAALKWTPGDAVTVILRGDYTSSFGRPPASKGGFALATGNAAREVSLETGLSLAAAAALYNSYAGGSRSDASTDFESFDDAKIYGTSLTVDVDLSDSVTFRNISALRYIRRHGAMDIDGSPFQIVEYPVTGQDLNQFTQENQIFGKALDNKLNWIVGFYYGRETGTEKNVQRTLGFISAAAGRTHQHGDVKNEAIAGYAQATFSLTDQISFTGGIRYTEDKRFVRSYNRNDLFCLALGVPLASVQNCQFDASAKFNAITYTYGANYQASKDVLIYAKASRGYRAGSVPIAGGSGVNPILAAGSYAPVRPEFVNDIEVGLKADWFDHKLRTNFAYFHTKGSDLQRSVFVTVPGSTALLNLLTNAASAKIDGFDASVTAIPVNGLQLNGNVSYVNARYEKYIANGVDLSSQPFVFTPEWTYTLSASYEKEVGSGTIRGQVDYAWTSRWFNALRSAVSVKPDGELDVMSVLNARLSYNLESAGLDFAVYGKNLTGRRIQTNPTDLYGALGLQIGQMYSDPTTFGFEVTKKF